ncbi:hypothetical protein BDB13_6295 [Rhodococcus sp. OK302]|nr:hypothetical protein BDB13_6295 [Rhodococcus sp. OK302]
MMTRAGSFFARLIRTWEVPVIRKVQACFASAKCVVEFEEVVDDNDYRSGASCQAESDVGRGSSAVDLGHGSWPWIAADVCVSGQPSSFAVD